MKRKYTKRKGVLNSPTPSPRKRVKSGSSGLSADAGTEFASKPPGMASDLTGVPDFTGTLQGQKESETNLRTHATIEQTREHMPPIYSEQNVTRDLLAKRPAIIPCQAAPSISDSRHANRPFSPKNIPSSTILGSLHEPFVPERTASSGTLGQGQCYPVTSIHQALLMSLQRQKPAVHITTASTVANQIHQLLASMPRNTTPVMSIPSSSATQNIPVSPIQSKVPTLVNSLSTSVPSATVSHHQVGIVNVAANSGVEKAAVDKHEIEKYEPRDKLESRERVEAIQKLQFHDFPLTTVSLPSTQTGSKVTQAKILTSKSLEAETQSQTKPPAIHITVNKSSHSTQMASTFANLTQALSSLSKPPSSPSVIITTAGTQSKETSSTQTALCSSTVSFKPAVEKTVPKSGVLSYIGSATVSPAGGSRHPDKPQEVEESLGKVSSLLESSPITEKTKTVISTSEAIQPAVSIVHIKPNIVSGTPASTSGHHISKSSSHKAPSAVVTSYTPTAKPVLSTIASTRTRRIRTPKQYDL